MFTIKGVNIVKYQGKKLGKYLEYVDEEKEKHIIYGIFKKRKGKRIYKRKVAIRLRKGEDEWTFEDTIDGLDYMSFRTIKKFPKFQFVPKMELKGEFPILGQYRYLTEFKFDEIMENKGMIIFQYDDGKKEEDKTPCQMCICRARIGIECDCSPCPDCGARCPVCRAIYGIDPMKDIDKTVFAIKQQVVWTTLDREYSINMDLFTKSNIKC